MTARIAQIEKAAHALGLDRHRATASSVRHARVAWMERSEIRVTKQHQSPPHCASLHAGYLLLKAKLELYRAMLATGTRKADLARRLKVHPPQIDRLLDLDHDSRIDQIEKAARALGHDLHIEFKPAA